MCLFVMTCRREWKKLIQISVNGTVPVLLPIKKKKILSTKYVGTVMVPYISSEHEIIDNVLDKISTNEYRQCLTFLWLNT